MATLGIIVLSFLVLIAFCSETLFGFFVEEHAMLTIVLLFFLCCFIVSEGLITRLVPNTIRKRSLSTRPGEIDADYTYTQQKEKTTEPITTAPSDDVFGAEFRTPDKGQEEEEKTYWRGKTKYKLIAPEKREKIMEGYDNLRVTFLLDNLFVASIGLCLVWSFGTFKDAFSYGVGSLLGTGYAALLARYVENLGSNGQGGVTGGGGGARFAPVVLLILLYAKNKEVISIIPELLGFFTFQIASLLQIFNDDPYLEGKEE